MSSFIYKGNNKLADVVDMVRKSYLLEENGKTLVIS